MKTMFGRCGSAAGVADTIELRQNTNPPSSLRSDKRCMECSYGQWRLIPRELRQPERTSTFSIQYPVFYITKNTQYRRGARNADVPADNDSCMLCVPRVIRANQCCRWSVCR